MLYFSFFNWALIHRGLVLAVIDTLCLAFWISGFVRINTLQIMEDLRTHPCL